MPLDIIEPCDGPLGAGWQAKTGVGVESHPGGKLRVDVSSNGQSWGRKRVARVAAAPNDSLFWVQVNGPVTTGAIFYTFFRDTAGKGIYLRYHRHSSTGITLILATLAGNTALNWIISGVSDERFIGLVTDANRVMRVRHAPKLANGLPDVANAAIPTAFGDPGINPAGAYTWNPDEIELEWAFSQSLAQPAWIELDGFNTAANTAGRSGAALRREFELGLR